MKSTILASIFMITALSTCILGQTPSGKSGNDEKAKNEVSALAEAYFKASVKRDAETMNRILSDNYVSIVSSADVEDFLNYGIPFHKETIIKSFKEPLPDDPRMASIETDEIFNEVRVYGETAVLTTKITVKWQGAREELAKKYRFMPRKDDFIVTLVAVKKNDVWQIVSTHQSEFQIKSNLSPDPRKRA